MLSSACLAFSSELQVFNSPFGIVELSQYSAGISLGMRPANERRRYNVTMSLTGWVRT